MVHARQDSDEYVDEKHWTSDPQPDKGYGPWLYLLGCYTLEGAVWGLALSWGVFQNHYSKHAPFAHQSASLPVVGTCAAALAYFGLPIITPVMQRYPKLLVPGVWLGWSMCLLALVLASFATSVSHLIATQGILFGCGWAICYTPFLIMLNQWFVKRRGTAYGILFGSSGLFAMFLPFALEASLKRFEFRTTLRLTALGIFLVSGPCMFLIKPRVKRAASSNHQSASSERHALVSRSPVFWIFCAGSLLQGVTWFLPRFFLPSFVADLGMPRESGAFLLAAFGIAQVAGQMILGWSSDKMSVHVATTLSTVVAGLSTLLLWAPASQLMPRHVLVPLTIYALLYGGFGGAYSVLWARMARVVTDNEDGIMMVYSAFSIMRGIANVLSGPVSALLLLKEIELGKYGLVRYSGIAIFVGVGMLLSALSACAACFTRRKKGDEKDAKDQTEMEPFVSSPVESEESA